MKNPEAVIVGAGHNGLTSAAFLAKAGLDVVRVDKYDYISGPQWQLEKLDIEGNTYSHHSYIYAKRNGNKAEIGFVTSAAWSRIWYPLLLPY